MTKGDNRILVLGIGNILMGDEGVGSHVAQFLQNYNLPEEIDCIDGGTGGFHLLEYIQNARKVFIIDATNDGHKSGTISCIEPRYSKDYPKSLTAHDIGLKDLIDAFYLLGKTPQIKLYAISITPPKSPTMDLTQKIKNIIPRVADMVVSDVVQYLDSST